MFFFSSKNVFPIALAWHRLDILASYNCAQARQLSSHCEGKVISFRRAFAIAIIFRRIRCIVCALAQTTEKEHD